MLDFFLSFLMSNSGYNTWKHLLISTLYVRENMPFFRNPILDCTTANREKMREAERLIKSFYDFKDACSDEPKEKSNTVKERQRRNKLGAAFSDSIINNVRSTIKKPAVGSLVYCDLAFSTVEHTGIYVGYNKIIHLNGDGIIEKVSPEEFLNRLGGLNSAIHIYVSCDGKKAKGHRTVAEHAKRRLGQKLSYHVVNNNCHKFSYECLTGKRTNNRIWFNDLIEDAEKILDANDWRIWKFSES